MSNISINLLPIEFTQREIKREKFVRIQAAGVGVILFMVFLSSLVIALRILQSKNIDLVQSKVVKAQQQVSDLKEKQASLVILKNRLSAIDQYLGTSSKQSSMVALLSKLFSSVSVNSISVDKSGDAIIVFLSPDSQTLDRIIASLINKETSGGQIASVSIDSLNRGRDGLYRVSLKIKAK